MNAMRLSACFWVCSGSGDGAGRGNRVKADTRMGGGGNAEGRMGWVRSDPDSSTADAPTAEAPLTTPPPPPPSPQRLGVGRMQRRRGRAGDGRMEEPRQHRRRRLHGEARPRPDAAARRIRCAQGQGVTRHGSCGRRTPATALPCGFGGGARLCGGPARGGFGGKHAGESRRPAVRRGRMKSASWPGRPPWEVGSAAAGGDGRRLVRAATTGTEPPGTPGRSLRAHGHRRSRGRRAAQGSTGRTSGRSRARCRG